jgi:2',3'-cyclic-nucleotide 2'-phosphodiesterase (5'-nucleotidase family)
MEEGGSYIYVYLKATPSQAVGDIVEVTGTTTTFGGAVQFGSDSVVTKINTITVTVPTANELAGTAITNYADNFAVGDYIEITGNLIVDGTYVNLILADTTVKGSLQSLSTELDLSTYNGKDVIVKGYVLYVSGSTTKYLNLLVTDIEEVQAVTYDTIAEVKAGLVGDSYTTKGTVVGLTGSGFLMEEGGSYIYVYLKAIPSQAVGDIVEVTGTTTTFGGAVQFGSDSVVTKINTTTVTVPTANELAGTAITNYADNFAVGDYIEITGNLIVDGTYVNLILADTTVKGSLQSLSTELDLSTYNGKDVIVKGYVLYVSGSTTKYLNVLVTDIEEKSVTELFKLTILTVNDLHGYIEQEEDGTGGISNMAYLFNQIRNENILDDVVLIANGDMFQGTAISNMTYGLSVLECMNAMGFDAMGIGNHEFDWGLDKILEYFDGDLTNGEANFPLLNANIYLLSDGSLLTVENGNVFQYRIIEKEGIKVGIISYIGDVYNSIIYTAVEPYEFDTNFANSVQQIANNLDSMGVDIIIVNIHDGNSSDIKSYYPNQQIAELKNSDGEYLVDLVINGHTHSYQTDMINRTGGNPLLLVQAGGKGNSFGKISFTIDMSTKEIVGQQISLVDVSTAGTNYDQSVQDIVDEYAEAMGSEALAVAGETVLYTSQLQSWVGNLMIAATGADIALSNDGGIRSTGNIVSGEDITIATLYEISPFDNTIILMELTYEEMEDIIYREPVFYVLADGVELNPGQTYTLAVISYVYGWDELQEDASTEDIDTGLIVRDLMIADVILKGEQGEAFSPISSPEASIGLIYQSIYANMDVESDNYKAISIC